MAAPAVRRRRAALTLTGLGALNAVFPWKFRPSAERVRHAIAVRVLKSFSRRCATVCGGTLSGPFRRRGPRECPPGILSWESLPAAVNPRGRVAEVVCVCGPIASIYRDKEVYRALYIRDAVIILQRPARRGGWVRAQQRPERGVGATPAAETPRPPGVASAPAEDIGRGGGV